MIYEALHGLDSGLTPSKLFQKVITETPRSLSEDEIAKKLVALERATGGNQLPGMDIHALFALITAGTHYLTLRSEGVQFYNGTDIQSDM